MSMTVLAMVMAIMLIMNKIEEVMLSMIVIIPATMIMMVMRIMVWNKIMKIVMLMIGVKFTTAMLVIAAVATNAQ